ncbi:MAG: hypothetical protein IPO25_21440 [Saprospiraceae bacterium]|nr:hypothetical protein [Saprospiraceae bacterium]
MTSGGEPTNDGDGNNGNLTVDFGLQVPALSATWCGKTMTAMVSKVESVKQASLESS